MASEMQDDDNALDTIDPDDLRMAKILFMRLLLRTSPPDIRDLFPKIDSSVDVEMVLEPCDRMNGFIYEKKEPDLSECNHFKLMVRMITRKKREVQKPYGRITENAEYTVVFKENYVNQALELLDQEWLDQRAEYERMDEEASPRELLMKDIERRTERECIQALENEGHCDAIEKVIARLHAQCVKAMGVHQMDPPVGE